MSFEKIQESLEYGSLILTTIRKPHYAKNLEHWVVIVGLNTVQRTVRMTGYGIIPGLSVVVQDYKEMRSRLKPHHRMLVCETGLREIYCK